MITEVSDDTSSSSISIIPQSQISSLKTQKDAVRLYAVAMYGMIRLSTECVQEIMSVLTKFLPKGEGRPWDTLTPLQRLTMTVMRTILLQLPQDSKKAEEKVFNIPSEMGAILWTELKEMVKILVKSNDSADDDDDDEDESVMIVSEARRSCFQLLRLLRSIRSDACDAMALRNVSCLCKLFRYGDGRCQRRVSEMLLSILSKNQNNKSALSEIFKMCWMSMQEHVVDEKKGRRAIIRLDYRTCSRLLSMTRADWKKSRHEQQTTLRQPPDVHVRVVSASELQTSSASRYAGHWGVLKRIRKKTRAAVVRSVRVCEVKCVTLYMRISIISQKNTRT